MWASGASARWTSIAVDNRAHFDVGLLVGLFHGNLATDLLHYVLVGTRRLRVLAHDPLLGPGPALGKQLAPLAFHCPEVTGKVEAHLRGHLVVQGLLAKQAYLLEFIIA